MGAAAAGDAADPLEFWRLFWFGAGWFGFVIMVLLGVCSLAALALAIENFLTVRRGTLVPRRLAEEVRDQLSQGNLPEAEKRCREEPGLLASLLLAGLGEIRNGPEAMDKAMAETAEDLNARLHRKIEYLNLLSSLGPMLGLLGTVWGMVVAFQQVAQTQGRADPGQLAGGIYQALYTTVFGLAIAIPGLTCYGLLRNRIDHLTSEAGVLAERVFAGVRRVRRKPPGDEGPPA
jgi:biopolymer transport protein ExbB